MVCCAFMFTYFKIFLLHFDFVFDPSVVQKCAVLFPHICEFFSFPLLFKFQLLWSEYTLDIISTVSNLLRLALWSNTWSCLENVPCALNVFLLWLDRMFCIRLLSHLVYSIVQIWFSLLVLCQDYLSILKSEAFKPTSVILLLLMSPFSSVSVCLTHLSVPMLAT